MSSASNHYDQAYFENYQKEIGAFGGTMNAQKFVGFVRNTDTVLDFGCGGGYILNNLPCKEKYGIEINPFARETALATGIKCFEQLKDLPDNFFDVIITHHCLEHVDSPAQTLTELYNKLKTGGKIIVVVPTDKYSIKWKPNDINMHLYSFSPLNLGNLLSVANFQNISSKPFFHKWPPFYLKLYKLLGFRLFDLLCSVYGFLRRDVVQIMAIGTK